MAPGKDDEDRGWPLIPGPLELQRSLSASRTAFRFKDKDALVRAHTGKRNSTDLKRLESQACVCLEGAPHVRSMVFGGLDGTLSTFAIVSGIYGAGLPWAVALVMGFASLVAEAMSMALGDYYSTQSEQELAENEREREAWEFDTFPEGEIDEMVQILSARGVPLEDAKHVVGILASHRDFFLDMMLTHELGILPPAARDGRALGGALVTLLAFLVFGAVPPMSFCLLQHDAGENATELRRTHFLVCALITSVSIFGLGILKARMIGGHLLRGGLRMVGFAVVAGGASYSVGAALTALLEALGIDGAQTVAAI